LQGIKGYEKTFNKKTNAAFIALPKKNVAAEKSFKISAMLKSAKLEI
jgi:hypothetical protein